jgi:hypothetical protein
VQFHISDGLKRCTGKFTRESKQVFDKRRSSKKTDLRVEIRRNQPTPSWVEGNNGKCATGAVGGNFLSQNVQKCCKTIDSWGEVNLLGHVARQSEHEVKRVVGRGIGDMLNWNHATGKGSIMFQGKRGSVEESVSHFRMCGG